MLSILHGLLELASKAEKGSRSTFFPISPRPVFESWIFSHPPPIKGEDDTSSFSLFVCDVAS